MRYAIAALLLFVSFPAFAQVRTDSVDGKDVITILERNDEDGGIITSTCTPNGDGTYYCYRTWEGRGIKGDDAQRDPTEVSTEKLQAQDVAQSNAEALDAQAISDRAATAIEQGISGKLHMPEE